MEWWWGEFVIDGMMEVDEWYDVYKMVSRRDSMNLLHFVIFTNYNGKL